MQDVTIKNPENAQRRDVENAAKVEDPKRITFELEPQRTAKKLERLESRFSSLNTQEKTAGKVAETFQKVKDDEIITKGYLMSIEEGKIVRTWQDGDLSTAKYEYEYEKFNDYDTKKGRIVVDLDREGEDMRLWFSYKREKKGPKYDVTMQFSKEERVRLENEYREYNNLKEEGEFDYTPDIVKTILTNLIFENKFRAIYFPQTFKDLKSHPDTKDMFSEEALSELKVTESDSRFYNPDVPEDYVDSYNSVSSHGYSRSDKKGSEPIVNVVIDEYGVYKGTGTSKVSTPLVVNIHLEYIINGKSVFIYRSFSYENFYHIMKELSRREERGLSVLEGKDVLVIVKNLIHDKTGLTDPKPDDPKQGFDWAETFKDLKDKGIFNEGNLYSLKGKPVDDVTTGKGHLITYTYDLPEYPGRPMTLDFLSDLQGKETKVTLRYPNGKDVSEVKEVVDTNALQQMFVRPGVGWTPDNVLGALRNLIYGSDPVKPRASMVGFPNLKEITFIRRPASTSNVGEGQKFLFRDSKGNEYTFAVKSNKVIGDTQGPETVTYTLKQGNKELFSKVYLGSARPSSDPKKIKAMFDEIVDANRAFQNIEVTEDKKVVLIFDPVTGQMKPYAPEAVKEAFKYLQAAITPQGTAKEIPARLFAKDGTPEGALMVLLAQDLPGIFSSSEGLWWDWIVLALNRQEIQKDQDKRKPKAIKKVVLQDTSDYKRVQDRLDGLKKLLEPADHAEIEVTATGEGQKKAVNGDQAAVTSGGIDLGQGDYLNVIATDAAGMPTFDPAQIQQLQKDLRGIIPVPVGLPQPVNVGPLLGLDPDQNKDAQVSQLDPVKFEAASEALI